jgi:hypothetical protein
MKGNASEHHSMDEAALFKEKLDRDLYMKVQDDDPGPLEVIIQTTDGLKDDDKRLLNTVGGKLKDNLYIINAFSADLPSCSALRKLILSPRIVKVYYDSQVRAI